MSFVYYLMLSPQRVKIGTTTDLPRRILSFRSDLQYVVALEIGGQPLEAQRHREFAEERYGRREDFQLSGRLTAHIASLQGERDRLVAYATTHPLPRVRSE